MRGNRYIFSTQEHGIYTHTFHTFPTVLFANCPVLTRDCAKSTRVGNVWYISIALLHLLLLRLDTTFRYRILCWQKIHCKNFGAAWRMGTSHKALIEDENRPCYKSCFSNVHGAQASQQHLLEPRETKGGVLNLSIYLTRWLWPSWKSPAECETRPAKTCCCMEQASPAAAAQSLVSFLPWSKTLFRSCLEPLLNSVYNFSNIFKGSILSLVLHRSISKGGWEEAAIRVTIKQVGVSSSSAYEASSQALWRDIKMHFLQLTALNCQDLSTFHDGLIYGATFLKANIYNCFSNHFTR